MGSRRAARECALQILYLIDVCNVEDTEAINCIWSYHQQNDNKSFYDKKVQEFSTTLVRGTLENKKSIDEWITKFAKNWDIGRMTAVDRSILRMASFELMKLTDIPINVIIDEAVELAKSFSTHDSGKFVNGILDKIKIAREQKE